MALSSTLASEEIELQVVREGHNKTAIVNFDVICLAINRPPEHVSAFLLNELGTYGAVDAQQRLVVKGRFLPSSVDAALTRYIQTYVQCSDCGSGETLLDRDLTTHNMRLLCQQCLGVHRNA